MNNNLIQFFSFVDMCDRSCFAWFFCMVKNISTWVWGGTHAGDFLIGTPICNIADLKYCKKASQLFYHANNLHWFLCCGNPTLSYWVNLNFVDNDCWWYHFCMCNYIVYQDLLMYFCRNCGIHSANAIPRIPSIGRVTSGNDISRMNATFSTKVHIRVPVDSIVTHASMIRPTIIINIKFNFTQYDKVGFLQTSIKNDFNYSYDKIINRPFCNISN